MRHILAALVVAAGFGGGGNLAKRIALERFPAHCAPYSIVYRQLKPPDYGWTQDCRISLDPDLVRFPFAWRCSLLVHEFGHLAGYPDERQPPIMRHFFPIYPPCLKESR